MRAKIYITILVILIFSLTACVPQAQADPSGEQAAIPLNDCVLSAPGINPVRAQCGTLTVFEDPQAQSGRTIDLNIAVIKAVSRTPAPDPIFMLAGGPGQAATEAFLPLLSATNRLNFKRDIVLVDQRGTGKSYPLDCPETEFEQEVIGVELPLEEQLAEFSACRASLDFDPTLYTTEIAMGDLDKVRAGLGYEQINLLGVSYGTRAALTYLRLFPERTRSLVLDGVVPPDWALGSTVGPDSQRALDLIFDRCAQDSACSEKFPDLHAVFDRLMDDLDESPVEVTVSDPVTAEPVRVMMSRLTVGTTVRMMSYSDMLAALIPLAVQKASQGDFQMLAGNYLLLARQLDEGLGIGMYYSVICMEDEPLLPETLPAGDSYIEPEFDLIHGACDVWLDEPAPAPAAWGDQKFDVPALIISGEADPVTPPEYGDRLSRLLPNSLHLVAPGLGHNNYYVGCIPELVLDFLEETNPSALDAACVEKIRPQPFFLSPTGPQP